MTVGLRLEGFTPYAAAHALQERLVEARAGGEIDDVLLMLEHPPTITVGRHRGSESSVLLPGEVPVVRVERGGDATYHGPGQLVSYPIVALLGDRRDLRAFLRGLESSVISALEPLGVQGTRDERNTGVWVPQLHGPARKICSIGIACRRWVTWHGLALNVDIELADFARIRPCGFGPGIMTRLVDEAPETPSLAVLVEPVARALVAGLDLSPLRWAGWPAMRSPNEELDLDAIVARVQSLGVPRPAPMGQLSTD